MNKNLEALRNRMDKLIGIESEIVVDKEDELGLVYRSSNGFVLYAAELWKDSPEEEWELWGFRSVSLEEMRNTLRKSLTKNEEIK